MRTIPEIVAEIRELIEELESHTGKPAPKQESPGLDFSIYNHDNMYMGATGAVGSVGIAGSYQATDTITLGANGGIPTFSYHDIKPLDPNDISFTTKS